ncbi:PQQ-like beta-propeller repeat protein [Streptomyces cocklensis]|uniref:outer membrane protein assembly factor BamB family protein n=1 Tax=Actinacidiphila cocklensis TaxID=887465 RepID=UPI0020412287|nr:PQQ-binding-like beta-propeller repeat protein [Actinacidiphila cocklensis]MDD1057217.1 PQQ-like beta-propeller repeat protein [Actinacidiphila cocklensis]
MSAKPDPLTAHDPPTKFSPGAYLPLAKGGLDVIALDGRKAYTYGTDSGVIVALDLATGDQVGEGARPQGNLPDRYGESGEDDEAPLCEQHPPAVGTTGSTRIAVGVFPTVAEGTGTTADTSTYELVALDTQTGEAAWNAPLGISVGGDFCHVAGISGGVAVVVLGGSFGPPNTYGVDLQSGKVVWTAEQFEAQSVQGAHVVGVDSSGDGGVVVALDPATGRTQWRAVDASASAEFEVTRFSAESVLVRNRDYSELSTVLRLKDGQQVDVVGMGERLHEVRRCLYDLQTRTLCFSYTTAGGELAAYEAKSGKLLWRLGGPDGVPGRVAPDLVGAFHGAVYGNVLRDDGTAEPIVLDGATGADRELSPGAAPSLVNEYVGLTAERDGSLYRAVG